MRKSLLKKACENHYGYMEAAPGSDLASALSHLSKSTIYRYIRNGWIKRVGIGLVLTNEGYATV